MSAAATASDIVEEEGAPADGKKKPKFSKRTLIIAGGGLVLVLILAAVAFFLLRPSGDAAAHGAEAGKEAEAEAAPEGEGHGAEGPVYVEAPAMVINLRGADGSARFLKVRFTFVPASAAKGDQIKAKLPLIVDAFQPFLRELRPEDLAGSAAVFRIKEQMLVRATGAMGPGVIKDILIQDLIQQ